MGQFALGVAGGVIAAFAGFVLKGLVTGVVDGLRIRKLLVTDIKENIRGLKAHYSGFADIEAGVTGSGPAFIWDNSYYSQTPDYVTKAIYHLRPLETTHCWRFFDALSRIDAIRNEYNGAVRSLITEELKRDLFRKIAVACLHDLRRNYAEAISVGSDVLLEIAQHHWFVQVDLAQCDADRQNYAK